MEHLLVFPLFSPKWRYDKIPILGCDAALASSIEESASLASLLMSDERYGELQTDSVGLEIAKTLCEPLPYDLENLDLSEYKGIKPPWDSWPHVAGICKHFGLQLAESLLKPGPPQ
jgi:hypothetical protein